MATKTAQTISPRQIAKLIRAAQAVCQSVNGSNQKATARQHAIDLATLRKALQTIRAA